MFSRINQRFGRVVDFLFNVDIIGVLLVLASIGLAIAGYQRLHGDFDLLTVLNDFYANISAEMGSIAVTVLIVDGLNRRRDERNRIKELQEQLIRDAGSSVNTTARSALDEMRKRGWLGRRGHDDTLALLHNADLSQASLERVDLAYVDLSGTNLSQVNLRDADLPMANLYGARLWRAVLTNVELSSATLTNVFLRNADLTGGNLWGTNLAGANITGANLTNANLRNADLKGANLQDAQLIDALISGASACNTKTILPDGARWSPDRDLSEFGAETRQISTQETGNDGMSTYTFADGTTRRWQRGTGWLDDRDGNPIGDA